MNVQHGLIQELMLYKFKLVHNVVETLVVGKVRAQLITVQ